MNMDNGVQSYATGTAEVEIHFPNKDCAYRWCWLFLKYEENYKRYSCRLTGEWILDPYHQIGAECPLKFKKEE